MIFTQEHKIVNALVPVDGQNTALATDIISLKGYDHCTFIFQIGIANTSSATSVNLIANKGEDLSTCAEPFAAKYRVEDTASGDTLDAVTTLTSGGVSLGSGNTVDYDEGLCLVVVEIDAADLAPTRANPYDTVKMSLTLSNHSCLISGIAILSKGRHQDTSQPTAIA